MSGGGDSASPERPRPVRRAWMRLAAVLAVLAVAAAAGSRLHLEDYFTREHIGATITAIQAWVGQFGCWGPVLFILACASVTLIRLPVTLVAFFSVTLYGEAWGCAACFVIIALGSSLVHGVSRWAGKPFVERLFGARMKRMEERFSRRPLMHVIMLRLALTMNPLLNWALGISGVSYRNMLVGTVIGVAPMVFVLVLLSGELIQYVKTGASFNPLTHPHLLIPLVLAVVLFGAHRYIDRMDRTRGGAPR